jgi:alkaline phosphatase
MNRILLICFLATAAFLFPACKDSGQKAKHPRNVILLIGDGMGLSQVSASFYFQEGNPNFSRFPYVGLIRTSSARQKITDSASGATAFSMGKKSYNGAIGVDVDTLAHETLVELAATRGVKTGLLATSSITHATPASFYAHVPSRNQHEEIARDLSHSAVDIFIGGGLQFFASRKDSLNYLDTLTARGFIVDTTALTAGKLDPNGRYGWLLAPDGMPTMLEGRGDFLTRSVTTALDFLAPQPKGFFLMTEGSQIDWGGHDNNADYLIAELLDFDKAIGAALDFAEKDGNTLVVVTADHETGGFSLSSTPRLTDAGKMSSDYDEITPTFSTGGHTTTLIPVFAYGPGAEAFTGIYENTGIFDKIVAAFGWK